MIKISRYLYLHWLTVALFVCAYITRTLELTAAVYSVMLLHELAHTAAAAALRLGVVRIVMYPFGVTLRLQTGIICSMADAVVLYLSGPCVNIAAALVCGAAAGKNAFYYNNIILFVLNMLPVLPLDGGQLAQYYLSAKIGAKRADMILKLAAVILAAAITCAVLYFGGFGINSAAFCGFLLASIFTQRPKYSRDYVRELAGTMKKRRRPGRAAVIIADESTPKRKIAEMLNPAHENVILMCGRSGKRILTDEELICEVLKNN